MCSGCRDTLIDSFVLQSLPAVLPRSFNNNNNKMIMIFNVLEFFKI